MAQPSDIQVFERLQSYPFSSDPEFANGLSIILGHPETPATEVEMNRDDDLVLQAKCFFFSRYAGNICIIAMSLMWYGFIGKSSSLQPLTLRLSSHG